MTMTSTKTARLISMPTTNDRLVVDGDVANDRTKRLATTQSDDRRGVVRCTSSIVTASIIGANRSFAARCPTTSTACKCRSICATCSSRCRYRRSSSSLKTSRSSTRRRRRRRKSDTAGTADSRIMKRLSANRYCRSSACFDLIPTLIQICCCFFFEKPRNAAQIAKSREAFMASSSISNKETSLFTG